MRERERERERERGREGGGQNVMYDITSKNSFQVPLTEIGATAMAASLHDCSNDCVRDCSIVTVN